MFRWLRERRRRRILAEPFPPEWEEMLGGVALCKALPQPARERLRDDLRLFMAERHWEGCGGLELTDEIRVTVAAQAAILTLGRSVDAFGHVASVLVYPERFFAPVVEEDEDGVVSEYEDDLEGEAWERGTVILSWSDVRLDARRAGTAAR